MGPFFSKALDSIHSVRFSKFERLELLMNFSGKGFCRFYRTVGNAPYQDVCGREPSARWLAT
jgi:hypothetical protein